MRERSGIKKLAFIEFLPEQEARVEPRVQVSEATTPSAESSIEF